MFPTFRAWAAEAQAALLAHAGEVPGSKAWWRTGLAAAWHWTPVSLLALVAGAAVASPFELIKGGLSLGDTESGRWLLRQSWALLLARVLGLELLKQAAAMAGFTLLRRRLNERAAFAASAFILLALLLGRGGSWMNAAPLVALELSLLYAFARGRSPLVPCGVAVLISLASLYSARMIVLLRADLGSLDALPGIPGLPGVLAVAAAFLVGLALTRGEKERSGPVWGVGVYLASYLSYYLVRFVAPQDETLPSILKQTLLMPLDMLVYIFAIGAALEEVIFRAGLFASLEKRLGSFWPAALISAFVFSGFHFLDFSRLLHALGVDVSRLVASLLMVYGFTWAGLAGRAAAGILLAKLYRRSGGLALPIAAHFTSNLLEALGLRYGLACLLAAVAGVFALSAASRRATVSRP